MDTFSYIKCADGISHSAFNNAGNGNNVNVEEEMMDMAKTGQQYNVLATVQGRFLSNMLEVIRSGGS